MTIGVSGTLRRLAAVASLGAAFGLSVGCVASDEGTPTEASEDAVSQDPLALAAKEFEDLQLNLEIGFVGSFTRNRPVAAFVDEEGAKNLVSEMKLAFAGKSKALSFLHCETRFPFVATKERNECDYVVDADNANFEFRFKSLDQSKGYAPCMLTSSTCAIHQVVTVRAHNDGVQRPPVFALKKAASRSMLLFTNRVFYPQDASVQGFFRRWTEADQFAALVVHPYDIPREYGEELAGLLGRCGKQFMNVVNLSDAGIQYYQERKRPVVLSGILSQAALQTLFLYLAGGAISKAGAGFQLFKQGGKGAVWSGLVKTLGAASDATLAPMVLADMGNWRAHLSKFPQGSAERRAVQLALALADLGQWVGLAELGLVSLKHWRATAKVLSALTLGAVGAQHPSAKKHLESVTNALRNGNVPEVRRYLCLMQKEAGLRSHCAAAESSLQTCR